MFLLGWNRRARERGDDHIFAANEDDPVFRVEQGRGLKDGVALDEHTWRYSLEAGRRAQKKWANLEAAQFYERGLESAKAVPGLEPKAIAEERFEVCGFKARQRILTRPPVGRHDVENGGFASPNQFEE